MKKLLSFLLEGVTGEKNFSIEEDTNDDQVNLQVKSDPAIIGLIIGKNGNTIKAIQNILRVRARLENTSVSVSVTEDK
jgi:predicted RNA-binding protein YlqC (UPF0109 family)